MTELVFTSPHKFYPLNIHKKLLWDVFMDEAKHALDHYINLLWLNRTEFPQQNETRICQPLNQKFNVPGFMPKQLIDIRFDTNLSARALKCIATQACGVVASHVAKLLKKQTKIKQLQRKDRTSRKLQKQYDRQIVKLRKPCVKNYKVELNSLCCRINPNINRQSQQASAYVVLSSLWHRKSQYSGQKIIIPIYYTKHYHQMIKYGKQLKSFLIANDRIDIRFKFDVPIKEKGNIEGADQGIKTTLQLSDGQATPKCHHGHDLNSIINKMNTKKLGSNGFKRVQEHRTNYINWSVKQINWDNIKQLNYEDLKNVGKGKRRSRQHKRFTYKQIRIATYKACGLAGVRVKPQNPRYRSQRCSNCDLVHKKSRHGVLFTCVGCKFTINADLNAAINHKINLCDLSMLLWQSKLNINGFYWTSSGIFDYGTGEELNRNTGRPYSTAVPLSKK